MKADWLLSMILFNTLLSLLLITLETILYKTLQQEIGRHSLISVVCLTFGIKVTKYS